jgi:hypothetical protein
MLERATLIETFNHWIKGRMKAYKSKLNVIQDFERDFPIHVLPCPTFTAPPLSASRPLIWAQERYSLYPARWKRHANSPETTVKWGTVRALRSAAALQCTFNLLQSMPNRLTYGFRDKPTVVAACNPTDELGYTVFSDGMKRRLVTKPTPLLSSSTNMLPGSTGTSFRYILQPPLRTSSWKPARRPLPTFWLGLACLALPGFVRWKLSRYSGKIQ